MTWVLPAYFYILLVTFRSQNLILFYSRDKLISNISKRINESNDNISQPKSLGIFKDVIWSLS